MPIFKLTPIDTQSEHWRASTHKDYVIVRAENEKEARIIAELKFLNPTPNMGPGGNTINPPWSQSNLVSCQRLENSIYEERGPAEVLYPKI